MNDLLCDLNVLDLSQRLPGPMASYNLSLLGANVTKLENLDFSCDGFISDESKKYVPVFNDWYNSLNENKNVKRISFKEDRYHLLELINKADLVIAPSSKFFKSLLDDHKNNKQVIIFIAGGKDEWKSLHDLNALTFTKTFKWHSNDYLTPPYIPVAGVSFGQFIATTSLAAWIKCTKTQQKVIETLYLSEITEKILDSLAPKEELLKKRSLHNGLYPCYQLYKSKDQKIVALAAIEEKFWLEFIKCFKLNLESQDRFDQSEKTKTLLKNTFSKLTAHEIRALTKNKHICLSIMPDE